MSKASTTNLISDIERARLNLLDAVRGLSERQATFKPDAEQWSVVENVEHLYLAEISGVTKIWSALESVQAGVRWVEPLPNEGRSVEQIIDATWKPKETAPPIATPHIGGPLSCWRAAFASLSSMLHTLGEQLGDANLDEIVFPHFLCGAMDARQRLEFLRFHIERHHAQITRLMQHLAFPA